MIRLEKRATPSRLWSYLTPLIAVFATMIAGGFMFALLGKDPLVAIRTIFYDPIFGEFAFYYRGQLLVKAGPLILIAVGLSMGFRAGIWNIGAEGQYIMGAIFGAAMGLAFYPMEARWLIFPLMIIAGAFGGFLWAMIPARVRRKDLQKVPKALLFCFVAKLLVGLQRWPVKLHVVFKCDRI